MLIKEEAMYVWGQMVYGKSLHVPLNFAGCLNCSKGTVLKKKKKPKDGWKQIDLKKWEKGTYRLRLSEYSSSSSAFLHPLASIHLVKSCWFSVFALSFYEHSLNTLSPQDE